MNIFNSCVFHFYLHETLVLEYIIVKFLINIWIIVENIWKM